jgi:hypothetical protein
MGQENLFNPGELERTLRGMGYEPQHAKGTYYKKRITSTSTPKWVSFWLFKSSTEPDVVGEHGIVCILEIYFAEENGYLACLLKSCNPEDLEEQ